MNTSSRYGKLTASTVWPFHRSLSTPAPDTRSSSCLRKRTRRTRTRPSRLQPRQQRRRKRREAAGRKRRSSEGAQLAEHRMSTKSSTRMMNFLRGVRSVKHGLEAMPWTSCGSPAVLAYYAQRADQSGFGVCAKHSTVGGGGTLKG